MLPKDPVILLSFVNARLRDVSEDLEDFCAEQDIAPQALEATLAQIDYHYDREHNQFV